MFSCKVYPNSIREFKRIDSIKKKHNLFVSTRSTKIVDEVENLSINRFFFNFIDLNTNAY